MTQSPLNPPLTALSVWPLCCCCCCPLLLLFLQLTIKEGEISTGPVKQSKAFDIERKIQIVYLDENLRIAR